MTIKTIIKIIFIIVLPAFTLIVGDKIISKITDRHTTLKLYEALEHEEDRTPLNLRLTGYDSHAVERHWAALNTETSQTSERHFLQADLVLSVFYSAAFFVSLLLAWSLINKQFPLTWLILPLAITLLVDWIENIIHLWQLERFAHTGELQNQWIKIASIATSAKFLFFIFTYLLLLTLVLFFVRRSVST